MEVLGDDEEVESGLLGEPGVLDELLGLELLVSAEVAELGHGASLSAAGTASIGGGRVLARGVPGRESLSDIP
jgi:hypothetical protein